MTQAAADDQRTTATATTKQVRTLRCAVSRMRRNDHRHLDDVFDLMNQLYNALVEEMRGRLREHGQWKDGVRAVKPTFSSLYDQCKLLTELRRKDLAFAAVSAQVERGELAKFYRNNQARMKALKEGRRYGRPRFRPRSRHRSLEVVDAKRHMVSPLDYDSKWFCLLVKGLPRLKFQAPRLTDEQIIKIIRVVRKERRYEVQLVVEEIVAVPTHDGTRVGIDVGSRVRATLSDGEVVDRRASEDKTKRRLQRRVARAQKGSNSRRKAVKRLARHCERKTEQEIAEDHEITNRLAGCYSEIAVEDLSLRGMTASGGTYKRGMNREMRSQALGRFTQLLTYKAESAGGKVVKVNPAYTSQDCSFCGAEQANASDVYVVFVCSSCGTRADRDVNAARNIHFRAFGTMPARPKSGGETPACGVEEEERGDSVASAQNHRSVAPAAPCLSEVPLGAQHVCG